MGKPDMLDRVAQLLITLAAVFALANGAFMVWDPSGWYRWLPTVQATGPANSHFIRDVGMAYVTCAVMLGYAARHPAGRWLAALAGALWLSFHGIFHVWEALTESHSTLRQDAPGVLGPPLMVWLALGLLLGRQRVAPAGIPRRAFLAAVDRMAPEESAYLHEIATAPGHALEKLMHFMPVTMHRHAAPADLFHLARIGATLIEDCGPCALTAARGALGDGVARDVVNAALASNPPPGDGQVAFEFGQAIARQSPAALTLGDAIESKHGRTVRLELAMTTATVRAYPAMKRGLGLSKSCALTKLVV